MAGGCAAFFHVSLFFAICHINEITRLILLYNSRIAYFKVPTLSVNAFVDEVVEANDAPRRFCCRYHRRWHSSPSAR